jgi:sugar phosphate isomerase/epimerase
MITQRKARSGPHLDRAIQSLKELIPHAEKNGILIGIENRCYYREIPTLEELGAIFNEFKPGIINYWHDVGHAEAFDRLGFYGHREFLDRFSGRLIGMHLHDIIGYIGDHKAPGKGTFDFSLIRPYIKKDTIRVLEIHRPATIDDVKDSVDYLDRILS